MKHRILLLIAAAIVIALAASCPPCSAQGAGAASPLIERIEISGSTAFPPDELLAASGLRTGVPFNLDELTEGLKRLMKAYQDKGLALMAPSYEFKSDGLLRITLREFRFQEYVLKGAVKTRPARLIALTTQKDGELISLKKLAADRQALLATSFFDDVEVTFEQGRSPELVRVVLSLKEGEYPVASAGTLDLLEPSALVREPQFKAFGGIQLTVRELLRPPLSGTAAMRKALATRARKAQSDPDALYEIAREERAIEEYDEAKKLEERALALYLKKMSGSPAVRERYRCAVLLGRVSRAREALDQCRVVMKEAPSFLGAYGEFLTAASLMELKGELSTQAEKDALEREIAEVVKRGEEKFKALDPAKATEEDLEATFEFSMQQFLLATRGALLQQSSGRERLELIVKSIITEGFAERTLGIVASLSARNPARYDLKTALGAIQTFTAFQLRFYSFVLGEEPGGAILRESSRLVAESVKTLQAVEREKPGEYPQVYKFLPVALADSRDFAGVFAATRNGLKFWRGDGQLYSGLIFISFENPIFAIDGKTAVANLRESIALLREAIRPDSITERVLLAKMLTYLADSSAGGDDREDDKALAAGKAKMKEEAAEHLIAALMVDGRSYDALSTLGLIRLREGNAREAATLFERALKEKDDDRDCHYALAVASLLLGDREKALAAMDAFRKR